jgi:stage III sporulation protein SpoIIIAA
MIEAVENHMPEVVIVDEIGTEAEALACRSIAERGVQLVGTAHGQMLENLIKNPTLSDLVRRALLSVRAIWQKCNNCGARNHGCPERRGGGKAAALS